MNPSSTEVTIVEEITIDAPAERIFAALSDPRERLQWWGGEYFHGEHMESDLRPGGAWSMRGTAMGDRPYAVHGEYRIVEPPNALAFTWTGGWTPDAPASLVRFDLEQSGGKTRVRVTHSGLTESAAGEFRGWPQLLAWLQTFVQSGSAT
jgi:uncharacterized protein YndB with AHSA1/START domain